MGKRLLIVSFSVCPAPDRHGVGLLNVVKALGPRYTVDVLSLRGEDQPLVERVGRARMLRVPVPAEGTGGSLAAQLAAFGRAIGRQLEGSEYDAVHLRSAFGARALLAAVSAEKIVYEVARSTEGEPRAADAEAALELALEEQACLSRADLVLVPAAFAAAHVRKSARVQVAIVPPGVDIDHFDWLQPEPETAPLHIVFAGRIGAGRGVRLLLNAVGIVRRTHAVRLVLAGACDERFVGPLYEARVAAGLADGDVELLGPVDHDDMPRVLGRANICIAPATPDENDRPLAGFPTKMLEYLACRRAVVAPRRASVQEVITDGRDGLLFAPGDAHDLAAQIARLCDDVLLRRTLADAGYRKVRADYPASATRRRLLDAYAQLWPSDPREEAPRPAAHAEILPAAADTTARRRHDHDTRTTTTTVEPPRPRGFVALGGLLGPSLASPRPRSGTPVEDGPQSGDDGDEVTRPALRRPPAAE